MNARDEVNKQTAVGPSVGSSFGDLRLPVVRGKRATPAWFRQTYDYIVGSIGDDSFRAKFARQINDLLEKRRVEFERAEAVFIWLRISEPDDGLMSLIGDDNEVDEYLAAVETLAWLFHRQIRPVLPTPKHRCPRDIEWYIGRKI